MHIVFTYLVYPSLSNFSIPSLLSSYLPPLLLTLLLLTPASHTVTVTAAHMHGGPHDATAASHTAIVVAGCVHAILQLLMLLLLLLFLLCIRAPSR